MIFDMKTLLFRSSVAALPPCVLQEFETKNHVTLPDDYRAFLLKYNGGFLAEENRYFQVRAEPGTPDPDCIIVDELYGIGRNEVRGDIDDVWMALSDVIPSDCLPIGNDGFGNEICLQIRGEFFGRVAYMNHEIQDASTGTPQMKPICIIFRDLILGLRSYEAPEGTGKE